VVYCTYTGSDAKLNFLTLANGQWSKPQQILTGQTASSGIAMAVLKDQVVIAYNPGGQSPSLQMAIYTPSTSS
jgi:hypothetical protein